MKALKVRKVRSIVFSITLISLLSYILGWSSLLTVKNIEVTGTKSTIEIFSELKQQKLDLEPGMKLARVDIRGIKSTLAKSDWIDTYSINRNWLSGKITLNINEKTGVVKAIDISGKTILFDANGRTFNPVSEIQLLSASKLPMIESTGNSAGHIAEVAKLLQNFPKQSSDLLTNLSGISVSASGSVIMKSSIAGRSVQITWGGADQLAKKSKVLQALLLLPENKVATKFDVSIPDSPIVS